MSMLAGRRGRGGRGEEKEEEKEEEAVFTRESITKEEEGAVWRKFLLTRVI